MSDYETELKFDLIQLELDKLNKQIDDDARERHNLLEQLKEVLRGRWEIEGNDK